ncbi:rhodanese-like domain-containing protein [Anaerobacillus sp. CMMVII]|uniref:rhodanese-like domain-containing protein n=1 Tax=Anaerobacillus sp. CMMVII TaxID=2755588 RepID=UPI0021B7FC6A|nr:rhodanese-like domain-containing protein [Anaerobacillus sp. CMMVII]MCT8137551.1 rhodanese-like domain-containing protein [Anaerobacillus sp. CMMVII]
MRIFYVILLSLNIFLSGCSTIETESDQESEYPIENEAIAQELSSEEMSLLLSMRLKQFYHSYPEGKFIMKAEEVRDVLSTFYIIDIRDKEQYENGHLPMAVNIPRKEISNQLDVIPKNKRVLVVCDTGQSAAQASALLNFVGYNAVSLSGGFRGWNASIEGVNHLPVYELEGRMKVSQQTNDGAVYIDVREESEYITGFIEGFINFPLSELGERFVELPKDKEIIIICRTVNRSMQAAGVLLENGYKYVTNVSGNEGGMAGWTGKVVH